MKRLILALFAVTAIFLTGVHGADTSGIFKIYMHRIFDSYNHARISHTLKKKDISDIHLRNMQESIIQIQRYIPDRNKDGTPLDREAFIKRINTLQGIVADLRGAVRYEDKFLSKKLPQEIFNMCVACHKEVKLSYLFRAPRRTTLFGEYMHKVSEHLDLAMIYAEQQDAAEKTGEHLKLINYYLEILEGTLPEQGPSGIIMDRAEFTSRLEGVRKANKEVQVKVSENAAVELDSFRKTLNGLCVACHEPERIK